MTHEFWKIANSRWSEVVCALREFLDFNEPARATVNDESTPITDYSVGEDLELCRIHNSPRLRTYLLSAVESDQEIIHELLKQEGSPVRSRNHPLPA